ncbi:tRNA uridine(34) 5-carboxymethylaminomethyl modification radical SAM/GNAT enzyme Elp3 [Thermanaerothrix sp.]|uniref:elongator complex protein 3 n=1 Tax=Thermanaerothrix sp. TaxID=2972675 RepID=UPI002ADE73C6|nr:tRNA uridine(34) 5-carboxymethylaminomethyl modification radical SAM/GNAT enzyme Elp3 [Thermanaerothrix sp.]
MIEDFPTVALDHNVQRWEQHYALTPERLALAQRIIEAVQGGEEVVQAIRRHPLPEGGHLAKSVLVAAYRHLVQQGLLNEDAALLAKLRMKPVRTLSGVTTVTVLTKPYPCPGKCIFCPTDVRMPKSYLPDEPGAQRALQNEFDPYRQVRSRLLSYQANGHPTDKIELLILGGTWSAYRRDYQEWFVKRCLDALNEEDSTDLMEAQRRNETAPHRNVGLVIETRPDEITPDELRWLRYLGVTKVQMGVQSLDDRILALNQRGHTVAETLRAAALLRAAGFKIVMHWMPNLLGATPESDRADFARLWTDFCPDEIKIYPTQLLENTELYAYWRRGDYEPYSTETLIDLIADIKPTVPEYCRINRVVRDIPSTYVVAGNRRTSLRQDVLAELARRGQQCRCIRCREVRDRPVAPEQLTFNDLTYRAAYAEEHFLHYLTPDDRLAGYLRLSFPLPEAPRLPFADLEGAALIREVHVYGQSLPVGAELRGAAQHIGLGTRLLQAAEALARERGYRRLAVIAAIGTRQYYEQRGFARGDYYMVRDLA